MPIKLPLLFRFMLNFPIHSDDEPLGVAKRFGTDAIWLLVATSQTSQRPAELHLLGEDGRRYKLIGLSIETLMDRNQVMLL